MRFCRILLLLAVIFVPGASAYGQSKTLGKIVSNGPEFDALVPKGTVIEMLAEGKFKWAEGPVWSKEHKAVLFSDIPRNKIWCWCESKGLETYLENSGYTGSAPFTGKEPGSNGLAIDAKGKLIMCQHGERRLATYDGKKVENLVDKYMGKRFNSPNDLTIMSNGDIYFTDPPYGLPKGMDDPAKELDFQGVYRLSAKGELTLLTKELTRPNGICLSPDEKTLYVANSDPEVAVWMAFPVKEDGTLGKGKVFFDSTKWVKNSNPGLPDGMKIDKSGNLWATGPGGLWVFNSKGEHLGTLATGVPTANCNWGDDGSTLYITANDNLVRVKTKTKGW
ncbi:SMP-30/gluconolactonase/LRE family protein [Telmatocola sphagniphila]|uniref:SMP-30/gluconolactonase/LRE family protein n=1 Tax=Telmatocola sphagniphila TaxID=1123043 RepID=A0A8E6B3Y4_9BACT|nr:SMP-30/gluconolactonase/LRE family protein [Telmatocola sphagniphila]QVL31437.1 SMP-30/gluconolactonase/LRE family protein [Telmatocola sphagniphila]